MPRVVHKLGYGRLWWVYLVGGVSATNQVMGRGYLHDTVTQGGHKVLLEASLKNELQATMIGARSIPAVFPVSLLVSIHDLNSTRHTDECKMQRSDPQSNLKQSNREFRSHLMHCLCFFGYVVEILDGVVPSLAKDFDYNDLEYTVPWNKHYEAVSAPT